MSSGTRSASDRGLGCLGGVARQTGLECEVVFGGLEFDAFVFSVKCWDKEANHEFGFKPSIEENFGHSRSAVSLAQVYQ